MGKAKRLGRRREFSVVHPNAAIDIGATMHMAAVGPDCDPEPVRSFGTFTGDLHRLADWFAGCGVKTVVMESTGVYWIPVYEILDQRGFEVVGYGDIVSIFPSAEARSLASLSSRWC